MLFLWYSTNNYVNFIVALIAIILIELINLDSIISTVYYIKIDDEGLFIKYDFKKYKIPIKDVICVKKSTNVKRKSGIFTGYNLLYIYTDILYNKNNKLKKITILNSIENYKSISYIERNVKGNTLRELVEYFSYLDKDNNQKYIEYQENKRNLEIGILLVIGGLLVFMAILFTIFMVYTEIYK